jgi:hypothetical protein
LSYTNIVPSGTSFYANNLCQGTNNTLNDLLPNVPDGTSLFLWNTASGSFVSYQYIAGVGWIDSTGNPTTVTLSPGEGFVIQNPNGAFPMVISGCQPTCPQPCTPPTNGSYVLVGRLGIGTATYSDLFSCAPPCGTRMNLWNGSSYNVYIYANGSWSPSVPVLGIGQSAFVYVQGGASCCLSVNCSTNKTVACGSAWTFDPPSATTCCTNLISSSGVLTNLLITPISTVTNGSCPMQITRTWLITDGCGNSNTCSQVVSVIGCVPAPSGLVLWLPFDETSGTTAANLYAGGNSGVLVGGPSHNIGTYVANSLCFSTSSGVDQYVTVPDYAAIDPAVGQSFTLDAWVLRAVGAPNSPPSVLLDKRDPNTGNGYSLSVDYGHVILTLSGSSYTDSTDVIPADGQWHFVAVSVAFGTTSVSRFFVDGNAPVTFSPSAATLASTAPFHVAQSVLDDHGANQPWQGCIDEVEMFNRALSTSEIAALYQAGAAGKCKTPKLICSNNKTVNCGSTWSFDPPFVNDPCCGSNQPAFPYGPDGSGGTPCARTLTRTWLYVDCCGHSNFCSQTVTVVDTTPPVIHCLTNTIVVALNSNCLLQIPPVKAAATDNCTPPSLLHFTQSPPVGTLLANHSQVVTVTVTDQCGNSSHCFVTVIGIDQTPPVVHCPTNLVVTNCLVPCVLPLVTATDNCCPASSMTYVQSPPCNTPLGPGVNSVTVTVTDCHGNVTIKTIHLSITGGTESFLTNLFNTGVDATHALLVDNVNDAHYLLPPGNISAPLPTGYNGNAVAVSDICHAILSACDWQRSPGCYVYTPWGPFTPYSKWIAPNYTNNGCDGAGTYKYTFTFTLPANLTASSATISGRWAADNVAAMFVNGNQLPAVDGGFASGWSPWTPFTIPPGSGIISGVNTLTFIVTNYGGYTGLRVEYTNAYANCFTCTPPAILSISPNQALQEFTAANLFVNASGTPPLTYQWYHNNTPLINGGHVSGATTALLHVAPLGFGDAGIYTVIVSNPCGSVTNHVRLTVTNPWWWNWGWWNVAQLSVPLAASAGPDLVLVGSSNSVKYAIASGTTEDLGLPNPGGLPVNVMQVSLPSDASIQVPVIAPAGSNSVNSYSVILDTYLPSTESGIPATLFYNYGGTETNGTPDQLALVVNASGFLELSGTAAGSPFDLTATNPFPYDAWNRVAMVIGNPADAGTVDNATADLYLNGLPVGSMILPATGSPISGLTLDWTKSPPTILSRQTNDVGDIQIYASSLQLHAVAMTSDQLAGIGTPANNAAPGNDTSVGPRPQLSAAQSGGTITLTWTGSGYVLQETTDLASGNWAESGESFTESVANNKIQSTVVIKPAPQAPIRIYRLVFRP